MPEVLENVTINLFADDTLLYITGKDMNEIANKMNSELKSVVNWLDSNKLKLNVQKTKCMLINSRSRLNDVEVFINDEKIERVYSFKYLGVMIDHKLTMNENIQFVCKKLAKKIGFFSRIARNLTFAARLNVYKTIILPHFDYCSSLLMSTNQQYLTKLQRLQNRAIKIVLRCSKFTRSTSLYEALDCMNVRQRLKFNTAKLIFKIKHGLVPEYISERVKTNGNVHGYNLRNNGDFRLPLYRKSCTQRMLLYEGLKCFNDLPSVLKEESNFKRFTINLKIWCKKT